jgi:hypothetical protein
MEMQTDRIIDRSLTIGRRLYEELTTDTVQFRFFLTNQDISCEAIANPGWVAPAIEYGIDPNDLILNPIIDGKRKPLGEKSVTLKMHCMNPGINMQRFKV